MNIILLSRKRGRPVTVQLPPRLVAAALGVFALLFVAMGVGGVYVASHYASASSADVQQSCRPGCCVLMR